jgi:hypothetical protein
MWQIKLWLYLILFIYDSFNNSVSSDYVTSNGGMIGA